MLDKPAITPHPQWEQVMRAVCADTPKLLDFYERCAACGLPCSDKMDEVKAQHDFATKVLEQFFLPS